MQAFKAKYAKRARPPLRELVEQIDGLAGSRLVFSDAVSYCKGVCKTAVLIPSEAWRRQLCDCTDIASFGVAALRAAGIPAQLAEANKVSTGHLHHVMAAFLDGKTWDMFTVRHGYPGPVGNVPPASSALWQEPLLSAEKRKAFRTKLTRVIEENQNLTVDVTALSNAVQITTLKTYDPPAEPLVGVIIPVRGKTEAQLMAAVESVRAQTYQNWVCVLVGDGQDVPEPVREHLKKDLRFHAISTDEWQGQCMARNVGFQYLDTHFPLQIALFAFLDADDVWLLDSLETRIRLMREHRCHVLYTGYIQHAEAQIKAGEAVRELSAIRRNEATGVIMASREYGWCCLDTFIITREAFVEAGMFEPFLMRDEQFWLMYAISWTYKVVYTDVPTAIYNRLEATQSQLSAPSDYNGKGVVWNMSFVALWPWPTTPRDVRCEIYKSTGKLFAPVLRRDGEKATDWQAIFSPARCSELYQPLIERGFVSATVTGAS